MKKRFIFKGMSLEKFNKCFKSDEDCYEYLSNIKWDGDSFVCKRCGNTHHCKGYLPFSRRCTKCKHDESPTSGTMFDKIKFPILTAFHIIFDICRLDKGTSSAMLSEKYGIRQKTIWTFKHKIQLALNSQGVKSLEGLVFITNFCISSKNKPEKKDLVLIAGEILSNGEIGKAYGYFAECISQEKIQKFFEMHISAKAKVFINNNDEFIPSAPNYHIERANSHSYLTLSQNHILTVKNWLFGIHRHFSSEYLQGYLNEYYYRFNSRNDKTTTFDNAIGLMVYNQPIRKSYDSQ